MSSENKMQDEPQKEKEVSQQKKDSKESEKPKEITPLEALQEDIELIIKGVQNKEMRLVSRVLRRLQLTRSKLSFPVLRTLCAQYYPAGLEILKSAEGQLNSSMEDESPEIRRRDENEKVYPEVHVYLHLLCVFFLLDQKLNEAAASASASLFHHIQSENRRTLDLFSGKAFNVFSLAHERIGKLASIRNDLLLAHRTACLQHNEPGQAALMVLLLRNFLASHLYAQADAFRLNARFPERGASNATHARYLYYVGKIQAVQLAYSDAFTSLSLALRKAPTLTESSGQKRPAVAPHFVGFRQIATKVNICVQLLMGEIPEKSAFLQHDLRESLRPYLQITQAVRTGNLALFSEVLNQNKAGFVRDDTYTLITRLRQNVIKTGLRKINIAYSRISLKDICSKLKLESEDDAEFIVAKAIHDGVIEAQIDHEKKIVYSREPVDVYNTSVPQQAFHKRITFCMDVHNEAVKALQFPPNAHRAEEFEEDDDEDEEGNPKFRVGKKEEKKENKDEKKDKKDERKK